MNTLFEILPETVDAAKCLLVCEVNNEGFSYAIKDEEQNLYIALAVYEFEKGSDREPQSDSLQEMFANQQLLSGPFKKVCMMYSYSESVLIPFTLYSSLENENVLNLLHGDLAKNVVILTDLVVEGGVYNVYRVPGEIHKVINSKFPLAEHTHQYSILLRHPQPVEDKLSVTFYQNHILLRIIKNGRTELINTFCFNTSEDVSYILLNSCKQYEVSKAAVEISGLIEKDSNLYKEIYKYFDRINFAGLPKQNNYSEKITEQPAHYFSHIFAIDSCE